MHLNERTIDRLCCLINEETEYRSGFKLVRFFNKLGFNDEYEQGFPSRRYYTLEKLNSINETVGIAQCIKNLFDPKNFPPNPEELDSHIENFNKFLLFDRYKVTRNNIEIAIEQIDEINYSVGIESDLVVKTDYFRDLNIDSLKLDSSITEIIEYRLDEILLCFNSGAWLATILVAGSTLEGIFLGLAQKYPHKFNVAQRSPRDSAEKPKSFHLWKLSNFIDVADELKLINYDNHKFSHALRDFRNYIHPSKQFKSSFAPREHTAKICIQVLESAIQEMIDNLSDKCGQV